MGGQEPIRPVQIEVPQTHVVILVCPKSFDTVAMGTPLERVTVVANVCLAE